LNNHKNTYDVPIVLYRRSRQGGGTDISAAGDEFDPLPLSVVMIANEGIVYICSSITALSIMLREYVQYTES